MWEAPARGHVYRTAADVKAAYLDIFDTVHITKLKLLRQVATETTVVAGKMPNLPFPVGTKLNATPG